MRIVKSGDQYAIAKGSWIFTRFLDLRSRNTWWSKLSPFYVDCWGSREKVELRVRQLVPEKYETFKEL